MVNDRRNPPTGSTDRPNPEPAQTATGRAGEPPVFVDPRRWGALIGVIGGLVFIFSYAPALGTPVSIVAPIAGAGLAVAAVASLSLRPGSLGPLRRPSRTALTVYCCCVIAELAAIAVGSRLLVTLGHEELRPALIAAVVGVHFLPFSWAFGERMFSWLGSALAGLGVIGLVAGSAGVTHAADLAAVLSGLVMLGLVLIYTRGHFARADVAQQR